MNNLRLKLCYHLDRAGLPQAVVGVTELQPERFKREGYPAWHIHWVFVGRKPGKGWELETELTDKLWADAIHAHTVEKYDFSQSCRLERIRKSAAGYLAKYMSKGSSAVQEVEEVWPGCVPSSWYVCTASLRAWVARNTLRGDTIARWVYQLLLDDLDSIIAPWAFKVPTSEGREIAVCWLGRILHPPVPEKFVA